MNPIMRAGDDYKEEGDGWEQVKDLVSHVLEISY